MLMEDSIAERVQKTSMQKRTLAAVGGMAQILYK
jgi:hypothetical protein